MSLRRFTFAAVGFTIAAMLLPPEAARAQDKSPSRPKINISVTGVSVSEEDVSRAAAAELDKLELQKMQFEANYERSRHQALESTLARLVEEKLVSAEAGKQGITSAQLLANEVDKKVKEPSDQEVNSFYEANKARIPVAKDQVAAQIRQFLKQQSYNTIKSEFIERLKKANGVAYSIEPMRVNVETAGHPARGSADAPVTLVEFSDFQCPYCKSINSTLEKVLLTYGANVRLVFLQFPLHEIHPLAEKAAEASLCASEQGKFWPMHDLLFQEQANLAVEALRARAARLELDATAFNACLDSGRYASRIRQDVLEGARLGVSGTPALFVNGRFLSGARPYEEISSAINDELRRKKPADSSKP
jgi:protein-disulfide isomerase